MSAPLTRLIDDLLDGSITAPDHAELCGLLREDEGARLTFSHYMQLHGALLWQHAAVDEGFTVQGSEVGKPELVSDDAPLIIAPALPARSGASRRSVWYAIAAAVLLAAALTAVYLPSAPPSKHRTTGTPMARSAIAMISDLSAGARLAGSDLTLGSDLHPGDVNLVAGRAQIMFRSGAVIDMTGPCHFATLESKRARLDRGRIDAYVPHEAIGFVVDLPGDASIIDLGTHFAVDVDPDGTSLLVREGKVALTIGDQMRFLAAGESCRLPRGATATLALEAAELARLVPIGYTQISFDGDARTVSADGRMTLSAMTIDAPDFVPGRFGKAMHFDGHRVIETDLPGIVGSSERTCAAWVRIPKTADPANAYAILCWGDPDRAFAGGKWQVCWNSEQTGNAVIGALRCEVQNGYIVGSTDLRDGKWHHIAVVFRPGSTDIAQALLYVDAQPEATSAVRPQPVDTRPGNLVIGRYLNTPYRYFRGDIDELLVTDVALTPQQINWLMTSNRIRPTSDSATGESE
ncbi:MAG: hypothetical protein GC162_09595 [Planctomycetes bacterium]|nr:hypothetical protein [Planctomycetota bacterium]